MVWRCGTCSNVRLLDLVGCVVGCVVAEYWCECGPFGGGLMCDQGM